MCGYLFLLIEDVDTGKLDDRSLLKEIKLLRKILSTSTCRRAMRMLGIDAELLIPWGRLESSRSERLVKFARSH
jgi:hypothetical protein